MVNKESSERKSLRLSPKVAKTLAQLVIVHESWAYRTNTIIQAAIVAFSEMSKEDQITYLRKVHQQDGRFM